MMTVEQNIFIDLHKHNEIPSFAVGGQHSRSAVTHLHDQGVFSGVHTVDYILLCRLTVNQI